MDDDPVLHNQSCYIEDDCDVDDDDDNGDNVQVDRQTHRVTACKDILSFTSPRIAGAIYSRRQTHTSDIVFDMLNIANSWVAFFFY